MIIKACEFNPNMIAALPVQARNSGNQGTKKRREYKDAVFAFDIETTYIKELDRQILYIWQFQVDEVLTIIGRTWREFIEFYNRVNALLKATEYIVVYIHNLSYEFQFMRSLFDIQPEDVFVVKSRRILKWTQGHFEFRCSYLQTNLSLGAFTHKFAVKHEKLSGAEFDYSKRRYPDTPLTERELEYCVNDVRGLVEALKAEMARDSDNLYTIPLTSTGYVRRDVRRVMREWGKYRLQELLPSVEVYTLLREAFRGGNTHANRYFVKNAEFELPPIEDVNSADRSSSYPDTQVNYPFPMTPFKKVMKQVSYNDIKEHYINKRGYALIFRIAISNIELRDKYNPCPYISYDKSRNVRGKILDNGRILKADYIETTITDIDFKIIDKQYTLNNDNVVITDLYFSRYDYLPTELRELVKFYYKQKTELKGIPEQQLYYDKFKALINAFYGCAAQDPAKDNLLYLEDGTKDEPDKIYNLEGKPIADILSDSRPAMPYQWGVWTTARARELLQLMIDAVHENETSEFVYTDTDSVKYIGTFDLFSINAGLQRIAENNGAYADDKKGKRHYMGVYEFEGTYKRFETLGAKSYVYEDANNDLHITIAGVPKEAGAMELLKMALGEYKKSCVPIADFKRETNTRALNYYQIGTIFHDGITETSYHDERCFTQIEIDGHTCELTSDLVIKDSFHQIGWSKDYTALLQSLDKKDIEMLLEKR